MTYVFKKSEVSGVQEGSNSTFYEYKLPGKNICIGVSEINGRYPETGFDVDEKIEGCWYVEKGKGVIWIAGKEYEVGEGDAISVPINEKFYIVGENLRLIVASSPIWYPEQHKHVD